MLSVIIDVQVNHKASYDNDKEIDRHKVSQKVEVSDDSIPISIERVISCVNVLDSDFINLLFIFDDVCSLIRLSLSIFNDLGESLIYFLNIVIILH
jgi:hypothetical protein